MWSWQSPVDCLHVRQVAALWLLLHITKTVQVLSYTTTTECCTSMVASNVIV